jgi:hypothetical protein
MRITKPHDVSGLSHDTASSAEDHSPPPLVDSNVFDHENGSTYTGSEHGSAALDAHIRARDPPEQRFDESVNRPSDLASEISTTAGANSIAR